MDESLKDKVLKIYELVNRGATEGERSAAKKALNRIMGKYNLDASFLESLVFKEYIFSYTTQLELNLLVQLMRFLCSNEVIKKSFRKPWLKQVNSGMKYSDWVTLDCAYEYFRRHMKKEWQRVCAPLLTKCRKNNTRNKKRKELQDLFFSRYIAASKLCSEKDLQEVDINNISKGELNKRMIIQGVEGGVYNRQIISNLLLTNQQ